MREKFERNSSGWLGWSNNPQMLHLHANPETPKGLTFASIMQGGVHSIYDPSAIETKHIKPHEKATALPLPSKL